MIPPLWQKVKKTIEPLDESERGGWESVGLKLNIQKTKIMASIPITSWQIDGEIVADFILGGSKITAMVTAAMKLKEDAYPLEGKLHPI